MARSSRHGTALVVRVPGHNMGALAMASFGNETRRPVDYVDPLIDSANSRWIFFSSACRPFGMVNLSPDTATKGWWNSSYCYHTGSICGLIHVHQTSGVFETHESRRLPKSFPRVTTAD